MMYRNNKYIYCFFKHLKFHLYSFVLLSSIAAISQNSFDQLEYNYNSNTNQLNSISDGVSSTTSTVDIDNQNSGNYDYDFNGQLTNDEAEGIEIEYNSLAKVKRISIDDSEPLDGITDRTIEFKYDAQGNRVKKIETSGTTITTTYYITNALGELISAYTDAGSGAQREYMQMKHGIDESLSASSSSSVYTRHIGYKKYELKDQVDNVRVIVSDNKEPISATTRFTASTTYATDYYSFGALLLGRTNISGYPYAFQGKEKDDNIKGNGNSYNFGARILDPRIARWFSVDPLEKKYPSYSPYNIMLNNPLTNVDLDGRETKEITSEEIVAIRAKIPENYTAKDLISIFNAEMQQYNDGDKSVPDAKVRGSAILGGLAGLDMTPETRAMIGGIGSIIKNENSYSLYTANKAPLVITQEDGSVLTINNGARFTVVGSNSNGMTLAVSGVTAAGKVGPVPVSGDVTRIVIGTESATLTVTTSVLGAKVNKDVVVPYEEK